jgi:ankyrin repeat protein
MAHRVSVILQQLLPKKWYYYCRAGTVTVSYELQQQQVLVQATALWAAAASGHLPLVDLLLRHGADVSAKTSGGASSLHAACGRGHAAVVQRLVKAGAVVHSSDNNGVTCLMAAIHR